MEISFTHQGHRGRINVTVETTLSPGTLGVGDSALGLANCKATIKFSADGYLGLLGWIQLVRSTDNTFHGRQFEMDPFDPFGLYERAPMPYCWYGITPTLFEWDGKKATANRRKHKVAFELACESFFDPFACYLDYEIDGTELRERIVGLTTTWVLLYIVYVMRAESICIVSARMVTKAEREIYESQ